MVEVRYFGSIRLKVSKSYDIYDADRLDKLLRLIADSNKEIKIQELRKATIFINGENIVSLKLFKTKLAKGDEVMIMSPAAGG